MKNEFSGIGDEAILASVKNTFHVRLRGTEYVYRYIEDKISDSEWCEAFDMDGNQVIDELLKKEIAMLVSEIADNG